MYLKFDYSVLYSLRFNSSLIIKMIIFSSPLFIVFKNHQFYTEKHRKTLVNTEYFKVF